MDGDESKAVGFVVSELSMSLDRTVVGRYPSLEEAVRFCEETYDVFVLHRDGDRGADVLTTKGEQFAIDRVA